MTNIDTEKQYKRQNNFIKKNYDRHNLTMPKGKKERVQQAAVAAGQSVNEFINAAIDAALKKAELEEKTTAAEENKRP